MSARRIFELLGPFLGLVAVAAIFGVLEPRFLSRLNLETMAVQTVLVALGAIGMTFIIVSGGIDLSVGSLFALSSIVVAWCLERGTSAVFAAGAGVLAGTLCGVVNGLLVAGLRIVPFVATLGMMGVARGVAKWIGSEQPIYPPPGSAEPFEALVAKSFMSSGIVATVLLAVGMALVLRRTVFGTYTLSIGSNEDAARLCGVPVRRTKIWIYAVGGLFAGLGGVFLFARLGSGDPTAAVGAELDVIAAVVIGGASLSGGSGSILGSMIGASLMTALASGCNLTGVPNFVQEILVGVIIVAAVALDRVRH